ERAEGGRWRGALTAGGVARSGRRRWGPLAAGPAVGAPAVAGPLGKSRPRLPGADVMDRAAANGRWCVTGLGPRAAPWQAGGVAGRAGASRGRSPERAARSGATVRAPRRQAPPRRAPPRRPPPRRAHRRGDEEQRIDKRQEHLLRAIEE